MVDILGYLRRKWPSGPDDGDGIDKTCIHGEGMSPQCQKSSTSTTNEAAATNTKAGASAAEAATETAKSTAEDTTKTVPSVGVLQTTTASNANTATTTTSDSLVPTITTSSATSSTTNTADSQSSGGGGTSTKTKLAIAIPVAIVGALVIMGIVFFVLRRRRQQQHKPQPVPSNPYEENPKNESNAVSTSQLMVTVPVSQPNTQREPGFPRFPMLDVPDSREGDVSPAGSAGHMSQNDGHSEVGYGMAVSRDQRPNTTEQDHRVISRSASPANALDAHVQGQQGAGHDDAVSVVSENGTREQHYDDMSSVSSFDGDTPRADDHQHPFR